MRCECRGVGDNTQYGPERIARRSQPVAEANAVAAVPEGFAGIQLARMYRVPFDRW